MPKNWIRFTKWMEKLLPALPGLTFLNNWRSDLQSDENPKEKIRIFFESSLIFLFADNHPAWEKSQTYLQKLKTDKEWARAANFIFFVRKEIEDEIEAADFSKQIMDFEARDKPFLQSWKVFFPEGYETYQNRAKARDQLLKKRRVKITRKNPNPISDPARQILFTANVLVRPPLGSSENLTQELRTVIDAHRNEPQQFWYDHPIPLDTPAQNNEILYGLQGLDEALEFEKQRGNLPQGQKLTVVLSCSVTHPYLHQIARQYVRQLIGTHGGFRNLVVYLFTEGDCQEIIEQVLLPAAEAYLKIDTTQEDFSVFGTDGEYGRHYTFLKAIAAFWQILIDPQIEATFKIDLDQVFPQKALVKETGKSVFEMFQSDLWGAEGIDFKNRKVRLGMIAGALVNATDIEKSLFTPDVPYPDAPRHPEENIFFSKLPQALSTQVEMMTRYTQPPLDGRSHCLQRIHVTGGTNGILVNALFDFRPFTPTFVGRAEDQAFILSVFNHSNPLLRYVHQPGLIMRHDKQLFAAEAIRAAEIGKIIGDYVRMLYFSAYARLLDEDIKTVKEELDPFTGCFISPIPTTVVMLRFLLKGLQVLGNNSSNSEALEFLQTGVRRLHQALQFVGGQPSLLEQQIKRERLSWNRYYDVLQKLGANLAAGQPLARQIKEKAEALVAKCKL